MFGSERTFSEMHLEYDLQKVCEFEHNQYELNSNK